MKELEEKILEILRMHESFTDSAQWSAQEIAALIEPYQKLIEAQDKLIKRFDKYGGDGFWNIKLRSKIEQLKKELK